MTLSNLSVPCRTLPSPSTTLDSSKPGWTDLASAHFHAPHVVESAATAVVLDQRFAVVAVIEPFREPDLGFDLDFDFAGEKDEIGKTRTRLESVFGDLGLIIHDQSKAAPQYFLKYEAHEGTRNTIKIDVSFPPPKANTYEQKRFHEIDRIIMCQTIETMMANKLVALMDRYEHNEAIAGRDLYDIHHFFLKGYRYNKEVIRERTGKGAKQFFSDLTAFIRKHITDEIINQDLNTLLPYDKFSRIRKILKQETLMFLRDEQQRIGQET